MRAARGALVLLLACLPALRALHTDTQPDICIECSGREYCVGNDQDPHFCPPHIKSNAPADSIDDCILRFD